MELEKGSIEVGMKLPYHKKKAVTKEQLRAYADASGDHNPIHLDDEFAKGAGLDGVIAHGMLIMGFLGEYLMKLVGKKHRLKEFSMRFGAMTYPGDEIICLGVVKEIKEGDGGSLIEIEVFAQKKTEETVGSGLAKIEINQE